MIEITDDGLGVHAPETSGNKISLINCRDRLNLLYKGEESFLTHIHDKGSVITIGFPHKESLNVIA
jgi:LytS/YehU family sensor histidine kinase